MCVELWVCSGCACLMYITLNGAHRLFPRPADVLEEPASASLDPEGEGVHMCGAVNMLPGTAGVSWCSVTLRGRVFTCVEL